MSRKTFFDTGFAQAAGSKATAIRALKFLATNYQCYLPPHVAEKFYTDRPLVETPVNVIFRHLQEEGKLASLFAPIYLDKRATNVPETLTHNAVSLDTAQLPESNILTSMGEFYGKVVVNLGSILKRNQMSGEFAVADRTLLHNLYVRGALVMSYNDSDGWLTPSLGAYIAKSYSMTISGVIANEYKLSLAEQMNAAAVLSMYMCQMLSASNEDLATPGLFYRCTYLGSTSVLEEYIKQMKDIAQIGLNVASVCELIGKMCPERVQRTLSPGLLYRLTNSFAGDIPTSQISLEYPPYWVYCLCIAMSGAKIRLFMEMKNHRLQEEAKRFLFDLNNSMQFIGLLPNDARMRM